MALSPPIAGEMLKHPQVCCSLAPVLPTPAADDSSDEAGGGAGSDEVVAGQEEDW